MTDAIRGHSDYAKNAVRGQGVDRLLQGMRRLALETNVPLPEIYDDPGYVRSSRYSPDTFLNGSVNQHIMKVTQRSESIFGLTVFSGVKKMVESGIRISVSG